MSHIIIIFDRSTDMEIQKLINNNTANPLSPKSVNLGNCGKLVPGKFTFLQPNQLITKYVKKGNVRQNIMTQVPKRSNAYDSCDQQIINYEQKNRNKSALHQRVLSQAKKNSNSIRKQNQQKQKQIQNQIQKIQLMVESTYNKSADIMCGRNNSAYTRKQSDAAEISLKQMKQHNCERSLKKVEATRKLMISKSQKMLEDLPFNVHHSLQISALTDSFSQNNSSLLSSSVLSNDVISKKKKAQKQNILKKLIKNKSFQQLYDAKRRNAANEGFAACWQLGSNDKKLSRSNLFETDQKPIKKGLKKVKRADNKVPYYQQICATQKCQLAVNKHFSQAFNCEVSKFQILTKE